MSTETSPRSKSLVALFATVGATLALTGGGVYAALRAETFNAVPQDVSSGTLSLTLSDGAFSQSVSNLAPGDVRTQFVDVTNAGTLEGQDLTLSVTDPVLSPLTTDPERGLALSVSSCPVAWVDGACDDPSTLVSSVPLAEFDGETLHSGRIDPGEVFHLKLDLSLPDSVEVVENGVLPADSIQGQTALLTWRFAEVQRAGTSS